MDVLETMGLKDIRFASFAGIWHCSPKVSTNLPSSPGKRRSRERAGGRSGDEDRVPLELTIINQINQQWITTLLSALLGALVGGTATYWIGYKQRIYDLRRDAYLDFIELRIKGSYPSPHGWKLDRNPHFSRDLFLAKYKIDLIGSKRIKKIANGMIGALYPDAPVEEEYKPPSQIEDPNARWKAFTDR